jgi:hypothetical protein
MCKTYTTYVRPAGRIAICINKAAMYVAAILHFSPLGIRK